WPSSDEKIKRLYALGADHVIDYARGDFMAEVHARFGKPARRNFQGGVDVVIHFTGGATWGPAPRCAPRGPPRVRSPGGHPLHLDLRVAGPRLQRLDARRPHHAAAHGRRAPAAPRDRPDAAAERSRRGGPAARRPGG